MLTKLGRAYNDKSSTKVFGAERQNLGILNFFEENHLQQAKACYFVIIPTEHRSETNEDNRGESMKRAVKRAALAIAVPAVTLISFACNQATKSDLKSDKSRLSYAIGQEIGQNFKSQNIDIDPAALAMSVQDVLEGKKSALTPEELKKVQENFQNARVEKQKQAAEKGDADAKSFLDKNKTGEGWKVTASGLQYKVEKDGTGATPKDTDTVVAQYAGKLVDGTEFDSSYKRGEPAEFPVTGVIPGWTEALKMMKVGSKWHLAIPPQLAYGEQGRPPAIPPNSVLLFDIELVGVKAPGPGGKIAKKAHHGG